MIKKSFPPKRKILLAVAFLALLTIPLIVVFTTTGKKTSPTPISSTPNLPELRQQKIFEVEANLLASNYSNNSLLQALKEDYNFTGSDWKDYLNVDNEIELESRLGNVLRIVKDRKTPRHPLPESPGNQGPGNQGPGNQGPGNQGPGNQGPGNQGPGPTKTPSYTPPTSGGGGLLDDDAMKIIKKKYVLERIPELLLVDETVSETIKFGNSLFTEANLQGKEIIFLPVNNSSSPSIAGSGGHWSLLVYEVPGEKFFYYDSLGTANLSSAKKMAANFLKILGKTTPPEPQVKVINSPTQNDGSSCGVYTMAFIKLLVDKYEKSSKNSSAMNWEIDATEAQEINDLIPKMRDVLKEEKWTDTGSRGKVGNPFSDWGYGMDQHETFKFYLNSNFSDTALRRYIGEKFSSEKEKLINLSQRMIELTSWNKFKVDNKVLSAKICEIMLVFKIFISDKEIIEEMLTWMTDNSDGTKFLREKVEGKKKWVEDSYLLTSDNESYLNGLLSDSLIGEIMNKNPDNYKKKSN